LYNNAVKVPHQSKPAINTEIEGNTTRRRNDPSPEDETPIRTNTTSSKPQNVNQTSNHDLFFLPSADFNMTKHNTEQYAPSALYQSRAQNIKSQLPPKQTRPIAPVAPPRQTSSHMQGMPINNMILMTPPPIKSRVPPHSLLQVNVVTPDYTAAPREIQKKSSADPTALDIELARPKDLLRSQQSTSTSIKNSKFDNLIHDEIGEIAHLPPASTSQTLAPRAPMVATSQARPKELAGSHHSTSSVPIKNGKFDIRIHEKPGDIPQLPAISNSQTLSPRATVVATSKEVLVEQWLAMKCPYLHPDDLRNYAKKLTDMGFDSKMMLENELRGDDLNFMKVAHKRVILSSLGL
jgi:hypothetical protein